MRRTILAGLAVFSLATGAVAGPLVQVTGVADNDSLNLRAQPDPNSARVGTIDAHDTKIEVIAVDTKGVDWVKVRKGTTTGWVNAKFLQYETGAPVKMTCAGTEPFWSMSVGYGVARFEFDGKKTTVGLDEPETPAARPAPWVFAVHGKPGQFLLAEKPEAKCSDGMSDNSYPYSMLVHTAGVFMEGCCT